MNWDFSLEKMTYYPQVSIYPRDVVSVRVLYNYLHDRAATTRELYFGIYMIQPRTIFNDIMLTFSSIYIIFVFQH